MDFSTILKMMVATVQKIWSSQGCFLVYKNNRYLGLQQNNLNYVLLVNRKAFALHSNAARHQASGRIKCCTVSTVHGPALDRDATVKQLFLDSITPTRSKRTSLINMLSLYRFSTIEQTSKGNYKRKWNAKT